MSDPWWKRRKKKKPWLTDLYDELDRLGDLIDETMQKAFSESKDKRIKSNRFRSYSVKITPNGKPKIREIKKLTRQAESEVGEDLEPLVDVIDDGRMVVILAVLPGVDKDDINLRLNGNVLTFSVETDDFEWYDELNLKVKVDPKSARASYKNGILEIKIKKVEKSFTAERISLKK